jgi:hypothetical protein
MRHDRYEALGIEYRKQSDKLLNRLLLVGLLLLLSHMLQISPKEFDAAGAKIEIKDPIIIQGALAILFLHYLWQANLASMMGGSFLPISFDVRATRAAIRNAYKPYKDAKTKRTVRRSPIQAKKHVWWARFWSNIFMVPYALVVLAGILFALVVSVSDTIWFVVYVWHQPWNFGFEKFLNYLG